MNYKNLFKYAFLLVIISIITSCSQQQNKIGLLMDDYEVERWAKDKKVFVKHANELGSEVLFAVANGDADLQLNQATEMIDNGAKVLVIIAADLSKASKIIEYAHKKGAKVISYDRLIKNCDLDFYISFDNINVGKLQAEYLTSVCPKGKYVLIGGPTYDNNSFLLRLGQMNVLQPLVERGDIKIIYDQHVDNWTAEEGYRHMKHCLEENFNDIDVVIAGNDQLATGVAKALKEAELLGNIFLGGQDAELDACKRIVNGTQTMTVYKPIESIASTAASIAVKMSNGEKLTDVFLSVNNGYKMVPAVLLSSMVVNKGTIKMTVVEDGYLLEENIFKQ